MFSSMITAVLIAMPAQIEADSTPTMELTYYDKPLISSIENKLASGDRSLLRRENRKLSPSDRYFRIRFSRGVARRIEPAFPQGLPGMIPLLEHDDVRIRCAALLLMNNWMKETTFLPQELPSESLKCLRAVTFSLIANPTLNEADPTMNEIAQSVFFRLSENKLSPSEEEHMLKKLRHPELLNRFQIVQMFLIRQPVKFPAELQTSLKELLLTKSNLRYRTVHLLGNTKQAPPGVQTVVRKVLREDPHSWPAKELAFLLVRSGSTPPEAVPGLVRAAMQSVPPPGRMIGRGAQSFIVPDSPNRLTTWQERTAARNALKRLSISKPRALPALVKLLEAEDFETRVFGLGVIGRFGSSALVVLPNILAMERTDNRPKSRIQLGWSLSPTLDFYIHVTVKQIVLDTIWDACQWEVVKLFVSSGKMILENFTNRPRSW